MCWTMGSPHLVSRAPQARVAEGGRARGPTHHANQASLFWAPLRVSGGWRAGRPSPIPSWAAQAALYEALPTPYHVPSSLGLWGLLWNSVSPLGPRPMGRPSPGGLAMAGEAWWAQWGGLLLHHTQVGASGCGSSLASLGPWWAACVPSPWGRHGSGVSP